MLLFLSLVTDETKKSQLAEIYDYYKKDLYVTALSLLKDHHLAEDIVQDGILRISSHFHKFSDLYCNKTRSYFVIIIRNLCLDYLRRNKEISLAYEENWINEENYIDTSLDDYILKLELSEILANQLSLLHPPYTEIIMLRYYQGLLPKEISQVLGIEEANVRTRLSRALTALRTIMKESEEYSE